MENPRGDAAGGVGPRNCGSTIRRARFITAAEAVAMRVLDLSKRRIDHHERRCLDCLDCLRHGCGNCIAC